MARFVIVARGGRAYLFAMASALFRLLALCALLLMPAGMAGAPALAGPPAATSGHCENDLSPAEAPAQPQPHCAACAALPAFDLPEPAPSYIPKPPRIAVPALAIAGIEPEITTPPPKLS